MDLTVHQGVIPIVIDVSSADIMATLIRLKDEVEEKRGSYMRMVFARATEAHLLADEIGMCLCIGENSSSS